MIQRVAIFGNAGGGKSTLAQHLADVTQLPLISVDRIRFTAKGLVPEDIYVALHEEFIRGERWIIEGHGSTYSSFSRFAKADTLVYVDLPLIRHLWWITKRLLKGLIRTPKGWPDGSPLWASTLSSFKVVNLCERHLAPRYRQLVKSEAEAGVKRVHHLRSRYDIRSFLTSVEVEYARSSEARARG